jgi:hypothetical protein
MFQLTLDEFANLRSQFVASSWGGLQYPPYVFTEHGITILSSVLNSEKAIQVNVEIVRAFAWLRELIGTNRDLARRLEEMEKRDDAQFKGMFDAIRQLMDTTPPSKRKAIGFWVEEAEPIYRTRRRRARG